MRAISSAMPEEAERINIATPRSVVEDCMDRILKAFKEEKVSIKRNPAT